MADRIDVKIGASTGELKSGMDQAKSTVQQGVAGMASPFDQMRQSVTGGMQQMQDSASGALTGIGTQTLGLIGVTLSLAGAFALAHKALTSWYSLISSGIGAVEEFRKTVIGTSYILTTMSDVKPPDLGKAYGEWTKYFEWLYKASLEADKKSAASAQEILSIAVELRKKGVAIVNKEDMDTVGRLTDLMKAVTPTYANLANQARGEIEAVMSGITRMGSQTAVVLSQIDPEFKKNITNARALGTEMEYFRKLLPEIKQYTLDMMGTWDAVSASMKSAWQVVQIKAFGDAHREVVAMAGQLAEKLVTNGELTAEGTKLSLALGRAWAEAKVQISESIDYMITNFPKIVSDVSNIASGLGSVASAAFRAARGAAELVQELKRASENPLIGAFLGAAGGSRFGPWGAVIGGFAGAAAAGTRGNAAEVQRGLARAGDFGGYEVAGEGLRLPLDGQSGGNAPPTPKTRPPGDKPGGGGGAGGGPSILQQWVLELDQMKAAEKAYQSQSLQMEKAFLAEKLATGKVATAEELEALKSREKESEALRLRAEADFWKGKLLLAGEGTKEYIEVQHKITTLEAQQNKARLQSEIDLIKSKMKAGQDAVKDKLALIEHEKQIDQLDIKMKEKNIAHLAKMGAMSRVAELKEYKKLKQEEHLIDLKAGKEKELALKGDLKALDKHLKAEELLKKKHALELKKIDFEITEALKEQWGQVWNAVSQAFTLSIQGIITGTTTLAEALNNIWQSILTSLVGMFLQIALQYIASKIMMLIFGAASDKAMATSAVGAQSAIAGAAGFASVMVAVPFPANVIAAPIVGAAAAAGAASFLVLASAAGGWDVPADTLAMVHKDEKILPADWPEKLRAVAAPAGGTAGPSYLIARFPITVVTPDGRTILRENKTMFFDLATQGIKHGEIDVNAGRR